MSENAILSIWVPGEPKGQPRPRAFARNGRASVFDPGTADAFKAAVAVEAKPNLPEHPIAGPLQVKLGLAFPRPKSHYTKKGLRSTAPFFHTSRPDADNVLKAVLDVLTMLGMWRDDSQVSVVKVMKYYAEKPGAQIEVRIYEPGSEVAP